MRLYINAFKQGIARVFTLPRLSLPLITTLGLTLAAVLTVVAISSTLLLQPLLDVEEDNLYRVNLDMKLTDDLTAPYFSDPRRVASLKKLYGSELSWGHLSNGTSQVEAGANQYPVVSFSATTGTVEVLGLNLISGEATTSESAEEGVWISRSLWQSAFAGRDNAVGQTLRMEGQDYPVLGVVEDFTSVNLQTGDIELSQQIWRFESLDKTLERPDNMAILIGPMAVVRGPQSSLPTAKELETWFAEYINQEIPDERARAFLLSKPVTGGVVSYRDSFVGDSQSLVFLLLIAMVSLLVMACLNLLNMFIAHYQSRNKEFSIQLCMGSPTSRLRALIFVENLPMFLLAIVLGLVAAGWLIKILPTLAGDNLPLLDLISIELSSLLVALFVVAVINMVFAAIALLHLDKDKLTDSLNSSGKGTPAQQKQGVNQALMVLQLTLACTLLTTAIISVKKSYQDTFMELGYSMQNAYAVTLQFNDETWQEALQEAETYRGSELQQLHQEFGSRLETLGGKVLPAVDLPLTGNVMMRSYPDPDTRDAVMYRPVDWHPQLFSIFEIEMLAGRNLNSNDVDLNHIVVSKSFAEERMGDKGWQAAVGAEIKMGSDADDIFIIVGVVEETIPAAGGQANINAPQVYFPDTTTLFSLSAVVVMPDGQSISEDDVEGLVRDMDARFGELTVAPMERRWERMTEASRLNMYVVLGMAGLTMVLAAIGVSGLSQMTASQKRYELAVRMATGAKQSRLLLLLIKGSAWMLIVGLALGVVSAVGAYQYLLTFFESAPAFDWVATSVINFALAAVMLISIAIPGWSVIRKDPMRALREL